MTVKYKTDVIIWKDFIIYIHWMMFMICMSRAFFGMKSWMFLRNAITSLMRMQSFVSLVWDFFSSELFSAFDAKKKQQNHLFKFKEQISYAMENTTTKKPPRRQKNIAKIIRQNNKSFLFIFSTVHWLYFDWKCHRKRFYEWAKFNWTF